MSLGIPISVSSGSDPDQVERVLLEEAKAAAAEVSGLCSDPPPSVQLIPGFGESTLNFSLNFRVEEFVNQYPVQHELRKRILKRFRKEGIELFPVRTIAVEHKP